jgi:hypothetical protein
MEKIKILIITFLFCVSYSNSQNSKSIIIDSSISKYNDIAKNNMLERYKYTSENFENIRLTLNDSIKYVLSQYNFDEFQITSIPVFKLKKDFDLSRKNNTARFIDFKDDFYNQRINLYKNNKIIGDFIYLGKENQNNDMALLFYALLGDNFDYPLREDSLHGFLMKLQLETKYFVFFIDQLKDVIFIIKENKIYAITSPDNNGKYEEDEINYFFCNKLDCEMIKKLKEGKSFVYHKSKKKLKTKKNCFNDDYKVVLNKN